MISGSYKKLDHRVKGSAMKKRWTFENIENFYKYKKTWLGLGRELLGCDHPLIHTDYVEMIIKFFGPKDLCIALMGSGGEEGIVLLQKKKIGIWESFFPTTGPFTFALIKNTAQGTADSSIKSLITALPGYTCMLAFYKLDSDYLTVRTSKTGKNIEYVKYINTIRIPVNTSFEEYWEARSKNLKRNITKKINKMNRDNIDWRFRILSTPEEIHNGVEEYGKLESSGWKADIGTAVNISNSKGQFYVEMLTLFANRKSARIFQLLFNQKVVASALTIQGDGMVVILKIAYDEIFKDYSPGMIMYYELHKHFFDASGVNSIEYYGKATQRMQQWAVDIREIYHLNYYRSPLIKQAIFGLRKMRPFQGTHL